MSRKSESVVFEFDSDKHACRIKSSTHIHHIKLKFISRKLPAGEQLIAEGEIATAYAENLKCGRLKEISILAYNPVEDQDYILVLKDLVFNKSKMFTARVFSPWQKVTEKSPCAE